MTAEQWQVVKDVFHEALQVPAAVRQRFLAQRCPDETVRVEVERLLLEHDQAGSFLSEPLLGVEPGGEPTAKGIRDDFLIGQTVSHYRVLAVLGRGGMGLVYEGEDLKLRRPVALKFLPAEMATDAVAVERFEREARTASSLNHPNICTIYEVEEHSGQPFIVMELLNGKTLREVIAEGASRSGKGVDPLAPLEMLDYAIQIATGLEAAHAKGIVHRDIKPANLFVLPDGTLKILDFGLAKQSKTEVGLEALGDASKRVSGASDESWSHTGTIMGTAAYMSPEQIRGQKLDARTDLFSFGLVLYELASRQRAFRAEVTALVHSAILHRTPIPMSALNLGIPGAMETIIDKAIRKDREDRYQAAAEMRAALEQVRTEAQRLSGAEAGQRTKTGFSRTRPWLVALATFLAVASVVFVAAGRFWRHDGASMAITPKDTVVVADFENKTGDAVFDDALRQGLMVGLEQSPTIQVLSDTKASTILGQMTHSPEERITGKIARELCQRAGGKVLVQGSISRLGSTYLLGLTALRCENGESVAHEQAVANEKEQVLGALGKTATHLRARLGESMASIRQYNTPLEQATTPSLEALKYYSLGVSTSALKGNDAAIPLYEHAIALDPNFAMAYGSIAECFANNEQSDQARSYVSRAFALRNRATEYERLSIEGWYYLFATGELDKAVQVLELTAHSYPETSRTLNDLAVAYSALGEEEKEENVLRKALRLDPTAAITRANLIQSLIGLNRVDEAEHLLAETSAQTNTEYLLRASYFIAFLRSDREEMRRLKMRSRDFPESYLVILSEEAATEAYYGRFAHAHQLVETKEIGDSDSKESSAREWAESAVREASAGFTRRSREDIGKALKLAHSRDILISAAIVMAQNGDFDQALNFVAQLGKENPTDTLVQQYWLPGLRAEVKIGQVKPREAVDTLRIVERLELASTDLLDMYPVYVRGQAYLASGDGRSAAVEFQKLVAHPGVVLNTSLGVLGRLGRARAYALVGETAKAEDDYREFLRIWKDADPDIPVLKAAKAEYTKLQYKAANSSLR